MNEKEGPTQDKTSPILNKTLCLDDLNIGFSSFQDGCHKVTIEQTLNRYSPRNFLPSVVVLEKHPSFEWKNIPLFRDNPFGPQQLFVDPSLYL